MIRDFNLIMGMHERGVMPLWEVVSWLIKRMATDMAGTSEYMELPAFLQEEIIQEIREFEIHGRWFQGSANGSPPEDYSPYAKYVRNNILHPLNLI